MMVCHRAIGVGQRCRLVVVAVVLHQGCLQVGVVVAGKGLMDRGLGD